MVGKDDGDASVKDGHLGALAPTSACRDNAEGGVLEPLPEVGDVFLLGLAIAGGSNTVNAGPPIRLDQAEVGAVAEQHEQRLPHAV